MGYPTSICPTLQENNYKDFKHIGLDMIYILTLIIHDWWIIQIWAIQATIKVAFSSEHGFLTLKPPQQYEPRLEPPQQYEPRLEPPQQPQGKSLEDLVIALATNNAKFLARYPSLNS